MDYTKLYLDPSTPGGLGGLRAFLKNNNFDDAEQVATQINALDQYRLFKPIRKKFKRRRFVFHFKNHIWCIDLIILNKYRNIPGNRKKSVILLCIDGFSKTLMLRALRDKSGKEVAAALQDMIKQAGASPFLINSDRGLEFTNRYVKQVLEKYNIKLYHTNTIIKSAVAERAVRTTMSRLARLWDYHGKKVWVPYIQSVADSLNRTIHRTIGVRPVDVTLENESEIWHRMYRDVIESERPTPKFKEGQVVRISRGKIGTFSKGYLGQYSKETFKISRIIPSIPVTVELEGIKGSFYEPEIQLA